MDSCADLQNIKSNKDETFVYLYTSLHKITFHDYEKRWLKSKSGERHPSALLFGDDHCIKYYSYPTNLRDYTTFIQDIKNGRKYNMNVTQRWNMLKQYAKMTRIVEYWKEYAFKKSVIKNMIHIEPKYNVIQEYSTLKTLFEMKRLGLSTDILSYIGKFLFN